MRVGLRFGGYGGGGGGGWFWEWGLDFMGMVWIRAGSWGGVVRPVVGNGNDQGKSPGRYLQGQG